jgi:hypothetical protein
VNAADGVGVYVPSVTASPKESYVTRGGLTVASGTYTMSPAYGSSPGSGVSAYFLYGLTMNEIDDAINNIVRSLYLPRYVALSLINDGNMEGASANVTTDWPDSTGSPTQTKETSIVLTGTQSLKLVIATLDDSVRSQSLPVTEGDIFQFSTAIKCTAGSLRAQVYDVTNSIEIPGAGATVDEEDWTEVRLPSITIPADCQNIQIRYIAKTTSTTAYVDYAAPYSTRDIYSLPSQIVDASDVLGVSYLPVGRTSEAADSYIGLSEIMQPWPYSTLKDYAGVNSHRIEIREPCFDPLFVHFRAPDSALAQNTSDTDTTFIPIDVLVYGAVAECHRKMGNMEKAKEWAGMYDAALNGIDLGKPVITRSAQRRVYVS